MKSSRSLAALLPLLFICSCSSGTKAAAESSDAGAEENKDAQTTTSIECVFDGASACPSDNENFSGTCLASDTSNLTVANDTNCVGVNGDKGNLDLHASGGINTVVVHAGGRAEVKCEENASCFTLCESGADCEFKCKFGSTCQVHCQAGSKCRFECEADCHRSCDDGANCYDAN